MDSHTRLRRGRDAFVGAALALGLTAALPVSAPAASTGSSITVSTPSDPVVGQPGQPVEVTVLVGNNSPDTLRFTIQQRALQVRDEGGVEMLDTPDPRWTGLGLPAGELVLAPRAYQQYQFRLVVPSVAPDDYLVGFVVMPLPAPGTAGQVHIIGAVGGLFVVEVPGPRDRRLSAWLDLPRSALSSTVTGRVHVRNVGRSSLYFWAEDRTSIAPGGQAGDDRVKRTFLPAGRQRSFPVTVTANGLGRAHVTVAVFHNRADSEVVQDLLAGDVWLLPPPYLIGGGGLLGLLAVGLLLLILLRRRRRRRSERPAAERASRRPARGGRSRVEEG